MRPLSRRGRIERAAERSLQSDAARRWYDEQRSDAGVARRLEAIRALRDPRARERDEPGARPRRTPILIGTVLASLAAAAIALVALWLDRAHRPAVNPTPVTSAPPVERPESPTITLTRANVDLPAICTSITIAVANSSGEHTLALAFVTSQDSSTVLQANGILFPFHSVTIDLPASGGSVLAAIPCDLALPGMVGSLQTVQLDPSRFGGVVFTSAVNLRIDDC
jgi:hypothetical protein